MLYAASVGGSVFVYKAIRYSDDILWCIFLLLYHNNQSKRNGITRSRGFIFPEAFRLTLVKKIVRIKKVELRPLIKALKEKREIVSDWTKSVDQSKTEALVRNFQRIDKLFLPAQDWLRNFNVNGF